jgi:hypothetical protein
MTTDGWFTFDKMNMNSMIRNISAAVIPAMPPPITTASFMGMNPCKFYIFRSVGPDTSNLLI